MENDGNPALQEATLSDSDQELPSSELQLFVAQNDAGNTLDVADGDQVGPVNFNPSLEILVDGSDLLNGGLGNQGLELSIIFEKNNEEGGQQSELADQLDGVEVRVSLDRTQTVGVEVLSSHHGDHQILQHGDLQLGVEGPDRDAWVLETQTHALPALTPADEFVGSDDVLENCDTGEESQSSERKRPREGLAENARCLKSKMMEDRTEEAGEISGVAMEAEEHVGHAKSGAEEVCVVKFNCAKSVHLPSDDTACAKLCQNATTANGAESIVADGTPFEANEACGQAGDDNLCNNGSTDMATGHSTDDNIGDRDSIFDDGGRVRPRKKRKIAMLLSYCGAGFQGMQKNPGAVTIEGELEGALTKAGAMPENYDGNPRKVDWMRAARTDKGVSAVGQVVSGLFYVDPPGFVERVNGHLPKQIRLLGYKRVIPTFSAKKYCDRRRYEYVIPTFALDPSTHRDREAVLASEGKEDSFAKCLECSERGRKVPAGKVFDKSLPSKVETATVNVYDGEIPSTPETVNDKGTPFNMPVVEQQQEYAIPLETTSPAISEVPDCAQLQKREMVEGGSLEDVVEQEDASRPKKETFHFGEVERAKLNHLLNYYVGTHNFHNFTSRVKAEDPSAKRYMVSFEAGDVFTVRNTEFVKCTVVGQSFMLHQIRKMIGLVIAVFRGCAPESIMEKALRRDENITIPTAPELGLFLDECMYPAYNQKWYNTHEEVSQKGFEEEISRFKHDIIYEHIAATELKDGQMALFLHSLNDRNYADFSTAREEAEKQQPA